MFQDTASAQETEIEGQSERRQKRQTGEEEEEDDEETCCSMILPEVKTKHFLSPAFVYKPMY